MQVQIDKIQKASKKKRTDKKKQDIEFTNDYVYLQHRPYPHLVLLLRLLYVCNNTLPTYPSPEH